MLGYLAVLLLGFWLGVAIFLYISCYWLDEILDLPSRERSTLDPSAARSGVASGASGAHAQLKRLVARVVEEAASLPALARYAAEPNTPIENSTYEDLLATAILNKVIERYQAESGSGGRSSGIHSASASPTPSERSSPRSPHAHLLRDLHRDDTPPLRDDEEEIEWHENEVIEETIELPKRIPFPEFGGDIVHTSENDDRDFDEVSGSDLQASDGTWEENWLFQKKKIKTIQSVPVPMLVPNSNTEYRVLIGDKDVDDTSDLSDNVSDAEEEAGFKSDIKRVLDSKHVIGGKPMIDEFLDVEPDSLTNLDEVDGTKTTNHNNQRQEINSVPVSENNNEITLESDKVDVNNEPANETNDDAVLTVEIDSGPLLKPEFVVTEIHRTASYNKNIDGISEDLNQSEHNNEFQFDAKQGKDTISSYNGHEEERGYEETVDVPVQRYADSLRRKYYEADDLNSTTTDDNDDKNKESDLIPGSIADRERKKWLNYVDMPNNPYSPEAIQKRLSAKSTSSIFDTLSSSKSNLYDENDTTVIVDDTTEKESEAEKSLKLVKNPDRKNILYLNNIHTDNENLNSVRTNSPSPKILKDVLAEEVPQYKRYGRDYYIREAKKSSGGRKKSYSDTSSMSSLNKSTSLDNFDNDFTSPVSASSSLSDLEAASLHQNIVRAVLSPRNASPNFAINPIYENTDKTHNESCPSDRPTCYPNTNHVRQKTFKRGDGHVENEDIIRLKIPNRPEIVEESFETYNTVRRSNTLRSDDFYVRPKRRTNLNYNFGGSLRLNKNINDDLW
ncbi:hypothetical protein EVAR_83321_1 [Eumeta japonica]|uniref:Uncharacterized protein n=1 Tax=Eumeta variegata TaxID=151549 RepID=A0A4C1VY02_EUMVA|nr:hypothetical protein EVAR_83321_1 [Eumeta japonica]